MRTKTEFVKHLTLGEGDESIEITFEHSPEELPDEVCFTWIARDGTTRTDSAPAEIVERVAKALREYRREGLHDHWNTVACADHGYFDDSKAYECPTCKESKVAPKLEVAS